MIRKTITLGVAPVKRASRDMNFAKKQKDRFMAVIRAIRPDFVKIVDIDDLSENGIAFKNDVVPKKAIPSLPFKFCLPLR